MAIGLVHDPGALNLICILSYRSYLGCLIIDVEFLTQSSFGITVVAYCAS